MKKPMALQFGTMLMLKGTTAEIVIGHYAYTIFTPC